MDFVAAGPDGDVGAGAAIDIDARCFLEEPHAHLETEIIRCECADRADIGGVERVIRVEQAAGVDGEGRVGAALGETEDRVAGDFIHEADAAAAHDAAFVVEADARADIDIFRLFHLHVDEARDAAAVADRVFLEAAFARLVADRAVERVVDEEKFHHALAAFFHQLAGGANAHVFGDRVRAGDHWARHPADRLVAVFIALGFLAGRGARRHAGLHKAHTAVAGCGELRVIAVVGHDAADAAACLNDPCAFGKLAPNAVDLYIDHAFFGSKVLWQFQFRSRRGCVAHGIEVKPGAVCQIARPARAGLCRADPCRASVLSEKMQGFRAGMRRFAATGWLGAATGDRRYGGSTCFVFRGAFFALGGGGTIGIVAIGDDE